MFRNLCWSLLGLFLLAAPVTADVNAECDGCLHVALLFDRSDSMQTGRIDRAQEGAKALLERLNVGDAVTVISYGDTATTDISLTTIEEDTDRDAICDAVNDIAGSGKSNLGDALRLALDELECDADTECQRIIVVAGDGGHTSAAGEKPSEVVPDIIDCGIPVTTIGVGASVDTLVEIASDTGGCSYDDLSRWEVLGVYHRIAVTAQGKTIAAETEESLSVPLVRDESADFDYTAEVPVGTTCATFCLYVSKELPSPSFDGALELESPSGEITTFSGYTGCIDIEDPEDGTWTMRFTASAPGCTRTVCTFNSDLSFFAATVECNSGPLPPICEDYAGLGDVVAVDGDGVSHTYDFIQSAVNDAGTLGFETIYCYASEPNSTIKITAQNDLTLVACGDVVVKHFKIKKSTNISIMNFEVDPQGYSYACKLYYDHNSNHGVYFIDCWIHNASYAGVEVHNANRDIQFIGCTVSDNGKFGVWFQGDDGGVGHTVSECTFDNNGRHAIRTQMGVNVLIEYSALDNSGKQGIFDYCAIDCDPTNITMVQNTFSGNNGDVGINKDENIGHIDQIIDDTDDQPGY